MKLTFLAVTAAAALLTAGCSAHPASASKTEPRLVTALASCHVSTGGDDAVDLGDQDKSLVIDTKGDEDTDGMEPALAGCILKATKITDADMNLVESTRALDGRQQASWNGYDATWSYHPDTGLNMTLVDTK